MISIAWLPASSTASLTATPSPTPAPSFSSSPTATGAPTSSTTPTLSATPLTPSPTPTPTPFPSCPPSAFRTFPSNDLVGTPAAAAAAAAGGAAGVLLASSEAECQRACCASPNCTGYAFSAFLLQLVGPTAPCFLLANVTQLIPNHMLNAGVLASALGS